MRILWLSNAPWTSTGYGVQTRLFVPRLQRAGHEVAVCAFYGLEGGAILWNGIQCFPKAHERVGMDVVAAHYEEWNADLLISLVDAWAIDGKALHRSGIRWAPWFPVDMEPLAPPIRDTVHHAFARLVFSRFGERMCAAAGLATHYVPHGIDTRALQPREQVAARRKLGLPHDRFILGMVAANKDWPSRKAFPQVMDAFARFCEHHPEALLYLHAQRGDEPWARSTGINLTALVRHYDLEARVVCASGYNVLMGCPDEYMAAAYSAMDGLLLPSLGEGFGVPILEAQSCGCPVLVGDWTAMGELCFAGFKIPREQSEPFWTQLHSFHRLPHVAAIEAGMDWLWQRRGDLELRAQARAAAERYDADVITQDYWTPTLHALESRLAAGEPLSRKAALLLRLLELAPPGAVAEVGSLRTPRELPSDGWSTLYLARACRSVGRRFVSFEQDAATVALANEVLQQRGLPAAVSQDDGVRGVAEAGPLAFLYLDGSDDPEETLQQYLAAHLVPGAVIVVDDAQPAPGGALGKATALVQVLSSRQARWALVGTEPGYAAAVISDGSPALWKNLENAIDNPRGGGGNLTPTWVTLPPGSRGPRGDGDREPANRGARWRVGLAICGQRRLWRVDSTHLRRALVVGDRGSDRGAVARAHLYSGRRPRSVGGARSDSPPRRWSDASAGARRRS